MSHVSSPSLIWTKRAKVTLKDLFLSEAHAGSGELESPGNCQA